MIKSDSNSVILNGQLPEILDDVSCIVETILERSAKNGLNPAVIELAISTAVADGKSRFRNYWKDTGTISIESVKNVIDLTDK